ncbi:CBS domain-containing protein [Bacillus carboniphilus]|uniref:CBS domain-containing protein n=1 Tax=Bacillus carboniphilus TaxID=86663 RepID=A0ABP3FVV0_9BACI
MMSLQNSDFLKATLDELIIPAERVAHVQMGNNLEHALLVLTKTGYTAVPVLDAHFKLHGLISTPLILDHITGLERIQFESLDESKVEHVMKQEIPRIQKNGHFQKALSLLVDNPFVCVEDSDGYFIGILTRRALLKQLQKNIRHIQ